MFPYTNMHEMNLDWILEVIEEFKNGYITRDEVIQLINERVPEIANTLYSDDGNKALSAKMGAALRGMNEVLQTDVQRISDDVGQLSGSLGPVYQAYSYYKRGQVVVGPDWRLYMCTVNTAHGDWDPNQWQPVDLTTLIAQTYRTPVTLFSGEWDPTEPLEIPLPAGVSYDQVVLFSVAPRGSEYANIAVDLYDGDRLLTTFSIYRAVSNATNTRVRSYATMTRMGESLWILEMVNGTSDAISTNRRTGYALNTIGDLRDTLQIRLEGESDVSGTITLTIYGRENRYLMSNIVDDDDDVESGGVFYDLSEE